MAQVHKSQIEKKCCMKKILKELKIVCSFCKF